MTTTLTPPQQDTTPAPSRFGALRTTLRLHRSALLTAVLLIAVFAAVLLTARLWLTRFSPDEVATCGVGQSCNDLGSYQGALDLLTWLVRLAQTPLLAVPLVIAAYAAGPLTARERELGTHHLLWTQSGTSPVRWLRTVLGLASALVAVGALLLVLIFRTALPPTEPGTWATGGYEAGGPPLVAYSLLGLALGVCAGTLIGRVLPAMGVAVLGTGLVWALGAAVRPHLWPATFLTRPYTAGGPTPWRRELRDTLVMDNGLLSADGARFPLGRCFEVSSSHAQCAAEIGADRWYMEFHPAADRLPLQLVESGLVLLLAGVAVTVALLVLRRRTP